jgi:hypothetical protein
MSHPDYEIYKIEDILEELRNKINLNDVYTDDVYSLIEQSIKEIERDESNGLSHLKEALDIMDGMTLERQAGDRERAEHEIFIQGLNTVIKETCE